MGGHSKKSGRGGGGATSGRRQNQVQPKKLRKDPGVPDLKEVGRKLTATAQRKSHSIMSLKVNPTGSGSGGGGDGEYDGVATTVGGRSIFAAGFAGGGGAALRGTGASGKMSQVVARKLAQQQPQNSPSGTNPFASEAPVISEEERVAHQKRQMAAFALRTSEKVHDYEAPMAMYHGGDEGGDTQDMLLEDVDRRGTDKSLRRFFKEFNRVVESCDVLLQVLDARDPLGCRLTKLEQSIRSSYGDDKKKIVVVLNKVDMLPSKEVVDAWIHYFESQEKLTCIPFAATAKGSVGQSYVHNMFRKLRALARGDSADGNDRKAIVVGVIGYPNVGKSSIINALKRKNVAGVGNMPGFTTGNTEVELRSDIRVMDCPGVVMPGEDNGDVVLRGAVRVSDLANPFTPVQRLLQRCSSIGDVDLGDDENEEELAQGQRQMHPAQHHIHPLAQFYGIGSLPSDNDVMEFIRLVGLRRGRLTKGGQVDEEATARMILDDWNTGRIAYYTYPPEEDDFFVGNDFRAQRRSAGDDGTEEEVATRAGGHANFVSALGRGITLDGLPTFHLTMSRIAEGKGSRKKWATQYQDTQHKDAGYDDDDDDDDDELL